MKRFLLGAGLAAVALLLGSGSNHREPSPASDFDQRLHDEVTAGRIDRAHADLYRLFALKAPERLPPELRADLPAGAAARSAAWRTAGGRPHRCGTSTLRAVRAGLASMPVDLRAEAEALLEPPRRTERAAARTAGKTVAHVLPNWVTTENFSIEWGPSLTNEDGTKKPVRDDDKDGIPDVVELWASYFEASYQFELIERGFLPQAPDLTTNLIPVYIGNSSSATTIEDISSGTYAFTQEDRPVSYIVVNNNLSFAPGNDEGASGTLPGIHGAMKVTAAHELFHVVQFFMAPENAGFWIPTEDDWWLETSATWMEDEVFDPVNDYYQYYSPPPSWTDFAEAGLPVEFSDPHYTIRAYGGAIFGKYLSEHVGGHRSLESVWKDYIDGTLGMRPLAALDAFAKGKGFSGLGQLFLGFAAANATMDYREGGHYGAVPIRSTSLAVGSTTTNLPQYLGATYLGPAAGPSSGLTLDLSGSPAAPWGLAFAVQRGTAYALALGSQGGAGAASVAVAELAGGDRLYAAPCYLDADAPSASYSTTQTSSAPNPAPPGAVTGLVASPAPAGLDLFWATAAGTAGYVVRWRLGNGSFSSRTVAGPVTRLELRELQGSSTYTAQVFAYGSTGNQGPSSSVTQTTAAAAPTPTPPATIVEFFIAPAGGGGGGGGGGSCFISALQSGGIP